MNGAERHRRAMDIFDALCDIPSDQREAMLDEQCAGDAELRRKVDSMLRQDGAVDPFVAAAESGRIVADFVAEHDPSTAGDDVLPERIGLYTILSKIGEGGMGIIYEAQQESPRRKVALKVLRPGIVDHGMLKRFQQETHVLGQLQHPGIARIYEAGYTAEKEPRQPFFAMEFIDGEPLDVYAKAQRLDVNRRLELIARVADAVQHAHQKGIIHRDLKPSNILVVAQRTATGQRTTTGRDEKSRASAVIDGLGQPTILDFGIARITDADIQTVTVQTEVGQLVGTLAYMSPEQVMGISEDIDTRSDIYALGVMLYELVTGKRPHDLAGRAVPEAVRIIRDVDPSTVSSLDSSLRGDVDTIIAKAMDKDRDRRYASASDLASDIRRHLKDEPIEARPASTFYQLGKFARRNRALVGGVVATMVALTVGLIGTGYYLVESHRQRNEVTSANKRLQAVVTYQSAMLRDIDVAEMGRQIVADLRSEALANLTDDSEQAAAELATFEQVLSRISATTIASRSLDASIMSRAVDALDGEFADQPDLQADLRSSVAGIYDNIGLAEKALAQAEMVWESRRLSLGEEHPDTLDTQLIMCQLHIKLGQTAEAEQLARDVLTMRRRWLGADHVDTLNAQRILGEVLSSATKPEEAIVHLQAALVGLQRELGDSHEDTLEVRRQLGEYYHRRRDFVHALEEFTTILRIVELQTHPGQTDVLFIQSRIASVYFLQNELALAAPFFERVSLAYTASKGADHPDTLLARRNLANNLTKQGDYTKAEPIVKDILARSRRVLGPDHPAMAASLASALRLALKLRRWKEAEAFGIEALAIANRTVGSDNSKTLAARANLMTVYLKSGNFEAGEEQGSLALAEFERVLGADHLRTLSTKQAVAKVLMSAGKWEAANAHLLEIVAIAREQYADSPLLPGSLGNSITTLINTHRAAEAEPLARELLAWCEGHGLDKPTIGRCHLWIARVAYAQSDFEVAGSSLALALEILKGNMPEEHWAVRYTQMLDHLVAYRLGSHERGAEAEIMFRSLVGGTPRMRIENRNTLMPEARRLITEAGLKAVETTE